MGFARALRAGDDANHRRMAEWKAQGRFRQLDLEALAYLLNAPHAILHLLRRGPVVVVCVGFHSGRKDARVERSADHDADASFRALRHEAGERLLLEQRVASREKEHVEVAGAGQGLGDFPFVDPGADRFDRA